MAHVARRGGWLHCCLLMLRGRRTVANANNLPIVIPDPLSTQQWCADGHLRYMDVHSRRSTGAAATSAA